MIKMTMFLKRNADLSREEFVEHHIETHGPLFRSIPEAEEHVERYIQTHPIDLDTDAVSNADYDGTAEIWFDNEEGMEAVLTSETYEEEVFPDEKTFLNHDNTLTVVGEQTNIIE
ncbi:EthD domain-containing protein [Halococcus sp. IIIV-5B]|uniref:EthD domain-containing protein n=1 Tax=Halococcus sp. IIIV-5B TaxID=2321230 RepID=UPI000E75455B|nr:EthD domain-containing protein [Halococcus sp. IIIV-5B]RJT07055.1 EthD family reductase [Halococcus sp. IIIV-5B]